MRTIKVFIASSEELKQERLEIADVISNLNNALSPRDIEIHPVKWEYLDASMGVKHKQEEYNEALKECDICVVLYWTKFGEYTETELNTAYQELCAGRNPKKIYVYFKDTDSLSPQLKEFKDSFVTKYGHFFCRFANSDTMKLNFVLQVESFINQSFNDKVLCVSDGMISIAGHAVASFDNLPFAALNSDYRRLRDIRQKASECLKEAKTAFLQDSDNSANEEAYFCAKKKKEQADEEFNNYQESLLGNALNFVRMSGEAYTARMSEARELFESGRISDADRLLSFDKLEEETEKEEESFIQTKKNISAKINEWTLKASISLANTDLSYADRVNNAAKAYEKAVSLAEATDYSLDELSFLLCQQLDFVRHYALYSDSERIKVKLVSVERKMYALGISNGGDLSCALFNLAEEKLRQNKIEEAEALLNESISYEEHWNSPGEMPMMIRRNIACGLVLMGDIRDRKGDMPGALQFYERAKDFLMKEGDNDVPPWDLALIYEKLGSIYQRNHKYKEADESYTKALNIRADLFNLNFERIGYNSTPGITIVGEEDGALRIQYNPNEPVASDFALDLVDVLMQLAYVHFYSGEGEEEDAFHECESALQVFDLVNEDEQIRHRSRLMSILADAAFLEYQRGNEDRAKGLYERAIDLCETLDREQPGCFADELARILGNATAIYDDEQAIVFGERAVEIMENKAKKAPSVYYPRLISTSFNLLRIYVSSQRDESIKQIVNRVLAYYDAIAEKCPDVSVMSMPDCFKMVLPLLSAKSEEALLKHMIWYYSELKTSNEAIRSRIMICCILKLADYYRKTQGIEKAQDTYNYILPYALNLVNMKDESSEGLIPRILTDMALDDINKGLYEYAIEKLQYALERYKAINSDGKYNDAVNAINNTLQTIHESIN